MNKHAIFGFLGSLALHLAIFLSLLGIDTKAEPSPNETLLSVSIERFIAQSQSASSDKARAKPQIATNIEPKNESESIPKPKPTPELATEPIPSPTPKKLSTKSPVKTPKKSRRQEHKSNLKKSTQRADSDPKNDSNLKSQNDERSENNQTSKSDDNSILNNPTPYAYMGASKDKSDENIAATIKAIIAKYAKNHYPQDARKRRQMGAVEVGFYYGEAGVSELVVLQSSNIAALDDAALQAVQKTKSRFPIAKAKKYYKIVIKFTLN